MMQLDLFPANDRRRHLQDSYVEEVFGGKTPTAVFDARMLSSETCPVVWKFFKTYATGKTVAPLLVW